MDDATSRVTAAIQDLFRLGGSRRIHQQQMTAASVTLSPQGLRLLEQVLEVKLATPGQLATKLDLDPAVVTRLLRQLEEVGLIVRRPSPNDGRVTMIEATAEGRAAFERVRDVIWDQVRRTLAEWPDVDIDKLAGLLERLVMDVQQHPYQPLSTPSGNVCSNVSSR
jgi:DNA-binding MarR family transcriptional regulator